MESETERLHRTVGRRLRTLREERNLTQEKLAARAGVHRTFVGKLERGETATTVDSIATLCSALDIPLSEFFAPFTESFRLQGPRRERDSD